MSFSHIQLFTTRSFAALYCSKNGRRISVFVDSRHSTIYGVFSSNCLQVFLSHLGAMFVNLGIMEE